MSNQQTSVAKPKRETFSGQKAFIFAAIGSAVGLGNIWRFPYVTYDNGGGAFIIPYLVALLTAGIPLLFLDYAIGHKYRGSAPLSFRRMSSKLEAFGWWQVLINVIIGIYYAVILGWSASYTYFSLNKAWGSNHADFFFKEYLRMADGAGVSMDFVSAVTLPQIGVWAFILIVMALGVQKGVGKSSAFFMPLLTVMFGILVVSSLFLPGAAKGLDALFTPNWDKLREPAVWIAAYGQIFFSLSICFGIMVTYASYLKRDTDLTGSGLVVGFANSSFELLAGIGVFAALGFIATANGQQVGDVAAGGIGLAFIAFPTIINQAPAGALIGLLFFGSLVFAGLTSLISVLEVVIAAVQDKLKIGRVAATLTVGVPMMTASVLLFGTTTGLPVLDVLDKFVNTYGIVAAGFLYVLCVVLSRHLGVVSRHINKTSSLKVGKTWLLFVGAVTPLVLGTMLFTDTRSLLTEGYEDYPAWFVNIYGWGTAIGVLVLAFLLSLLPWKHEDKLQETPVETEGDEQ